MIRRVTFRNGSNWRRNKKMLGTKQENAAISRIMQNIMRRNGLAYTHFGNLFWLRTMPKRWNKIALIDAKTAALKLSTIAVNPNLKLRPESW
jgi:hypothetical protein